MSKPVNKAVKKAVKVTKKPTKAKVTKPKVSKTKIAKKIQTQEQKAGAVPKVVTQSLEGFRRIDHLPFKDQMNQIFNPLQAITKTEVKDAPSESTFVVEKKEDPQG
jgi:hypothetical protein